MSLVRRSLPLRLALVVLLPLSALAAVHSAVLPRWPHVADLSAPLLARQLRSLGVVPALGRTEPAWRNPGIALSSLQRIDLPLGLQLQLQRVAVRQRDDFQLAYASRPWTPGRRGLALGPRRQLLQDAAGSWAMVAGHRQRCLIGSAGGVTAAELNGLADRGQSALPVVAARVLGLKPNRSWSCLWVSLSHDPADPQASAAAAALWPRLAHALAPLAL